MSPGDILSGGTTSPRAGFPGGILRGGQPALLHRILRSFPIHPAYYIITSCSAKNENSIQLMLVSQARLSRGRTGSGQIPIIACSGRVYYLCTDRLADFSGGAWRSQLRRRVWLQYAYPSFPYRFLVSRLAPPWR